jgi:hypothetical protein
MTCDLFAVEPAELTSTCERCRRPFPHAKTTAKYCGQACKQAAYRDRRWSQDADRRRYWDWVDAKAQLDRIKSWERQLKKDVQRLLASKIVDTPWSRGQAVRALVEHGVAKLAAHDYVMSHAGRTAIRKHWQRVKDEPGAIDATPVFAPLAASVPERPRR